MASNRRQFLSLLQRGRADESSAKVKTARWICEDIAQPRRGRIRNHRQRSYEIKHA
jgi:hypothetical protein